MESGTAVWGGVVLPVPPGISFAVDLLALCFVLFLNFDSYSAKFELQQVL